MPSEYEPTQEEIASACRDIQSKWTATEHDSRMGLSKAMQESAGWLPRKKYKPRIAQRRCPSCGSIAKTNRDMFIHLTTSPECCEYLIESGRSMPGFGEVHRSIGIIPGTVCLERREMDRDTKKVKVWDVVCASDKGHKVILASCEESKEQAIEFIARKIPRYKQMACNRK